MIRHDRKVSCPILDRLEKRYSAPHWRFLREVRNDTGFQSNRSADAMAVGMYHSRGQILIGWGLMSVVGSKLSILKRAPSLSPKPLDRGMLAAIIERSIEQAVKPYLISEQEKDDRDYSEAFERGKNSASNELAQLRELKSKVEEFETASGVSINRWSDAEKIGEAVKAVLQHDKVLLHAKNRLSVSLRELIEDTVPSIKKSIAALEEVFDFSEVAQ